MEKLNEELQQKVDETFEEFWRDKVCNNQGNLDFEKVKRELYDYHLGMKCVSEVYYELTKGATGSIHADPYSVIKLVYQRLEGVEVVIIPEKREANTVSKEVQTIIN